jgi:hypothetical protein
MPVFFLALFLFFIPLPVALVPDENPDLTIVVTGSQDIEVYIAPIAIRDASSLVDINIDRNSVFGMATSHSHLANSSSDIKIYNQNTILYAYGDAECSYKLDPMRCSFFNDHHILKTTITINNDQFVIEMLLYDSDLQVVSRGIWVDHSSIRWIKQQTSTPPSPGLPGGSSGEDLPLKWVVPHVLLHKHLTQASLGLWLGAKF